MAKQKTAIVGASFSRSALRQLDAFATRRGILVSNVLRGIIVRGLAAERVPSEMTASMPLTAGVKSLRVPIGVKMELARIAVERGRTVSAVIRGFVDDEFASTVRPPPSADDDGGETSMRPDHPGCGRTCIRDTAPIP